MLLLKNNIFLLRFSRTIKKNKAFRFLNLSLSDNNRLAKVRLFPETAKRFYIFSILSLIKPLSFSTAMQEYKKHSGFHEYKDENRNVFQKDLYCS